MHCDVCAENVQPKLPRSAIARQMLGFNENIGAGHVESASLGRRRRISKMSEHRVPRDSFPDDHTVVVGFDGLGPEASIPGKLAAMST